MINILVEFKRTLGNENGKMIIRLVIVIITLLFVGIAIFGILSNLGQKQQVFHRKALAVSEYGLMKALQKVKTGKFDFDDIPQTECDEGWYSVSFNKYEKKDSIFLHIISKGQVGSISEKRECTLRLITIDPEPIWAQYQR